MFLYNFLVDRIAQDEKKIPFVCHFYDNSNHLKPKSKEKLMLIVGLGLGL